MVPPHMTMMTRHAMTMDAMGTVVATAAIDGTLDVTRLGRNVIAAIDAKDALDAADDAADRAADNSADRAGNPATFRDAMGDTARNALSLRGDRSRQCGEQCARKQNPQLHWKTLPWLGESRHMPTQKRP
jgi:hypothetical protein